MVDARALIASTAPNAKPNVPAIPARQIAMAPSAAASATAQRARDIAMASNVAVGATACRVQSSVLVKAAARNAGVIIVPMTVNPVIAGNFAFLITAHPIAAA